MTGDELDELDVVAIGHAIVDVLAITTDEALAQLGLVKGAMALIDDDQAASLYVAMGPVVEASGGSAANTAAGVASLGGSAAFVGKVRDDQLGAVFAHDIAAGRGRSARSPGMVLYFDHLTGPPWRELGPHLTEHRSG